MKSRFRPALAVAALLAATAAQAATGYSLKAPVLGHVLDSESGTLHRIDGIPGASVIGDALALDFAVARATVAPTQDYAIVQDAEGRFLAVNLAVSPPAAIELEGVLDGADGAMISPTGRRAALYSASSGKVQPLSGLPGNPTLGDAVELVSGAGEWTAFAISDRGAILAAATLGGRGALYTARPGTAAVRIGAVERGTDIAFFANSNDAVVADRDADEVIMIRDVVARRQTSVIASARDDLASPFGVEVTSDGRYVAVAMAGGVASVPVFGGRPLFTACACTTDSLVPLAGGNVFRITSDLRLPVRMVQVGASARMMYVPALPAEQPELAADTQ